MIKVGINGFGRIGRFVFRAAVENRDDIQIVGINDLCPVDYLAYMLKYDTMHGQFKGEVDFDLEKSELIVNGQRIRVTAERNPADLKWNEIGAEYVVNQRVSSSLRKRLRVTSTLVQSMSSCLLLLRTIHLCLYAV